MTDYQRLAQQRIIHDLHFQDQQVEYIGRILALKEKTTLVERIEAEYTNIHGSRGPVLEVLQPRSLYLNVILQNALRSEGHHSLQRKISKALETVGVDSSSLFSYCERSYGIEGEKTGFNVDVHFGF